MTILFLFRKVDDEYRLVAFTGFSKFRKCTAIFFTKLFRVTFNSNKDKNGITLIRWNHSDLMGPPDSM